MVQAHRNIRVGCSRTRCSQKTHKLFFHFSVSRHLGVSSSTFFHFSFCLHLVIRAKRMSGVMQPHDVIVNTRHTDSRNSRIQLKSRTRVEPLIQACKSYVSLTWAPRRRQGSSTFPRFATWWWSSIFRSPSRPGVYVK